MRKIQGYLLLIKEELLNIFLWKFVLLENMITFTAQTKYINDMKYLIIGGVAGGATAAARIRRIDEDSEIIMFEKGKYISYATCGLPYYIGGTIAEREKLFLQTPASFGGRFNIDVRVENEVLSIDTKAKSVKVRKNDGSEYIERYDKH